MKSIGEQIKFDRPSKDELVVEITPSLPKVKFTTLLMWGIAWTLCGLIIITSLFTYEFKKEEYLMVGIFLIFWTYFEIKVVHAIRWNKFGKEELKFNQEEFSYLKSINGRGFPNVIEKDKVSGFVFAEDTERGLWSDINKSAWFVGGEVVQYEVEGSVKRVGMKLSKEDATQLISLLNKMLK